MTEPLGCIINHDETARVIEDMQHDGLIVSFAGAKVGLQGFAKEQLIRGITHVFAQDTERRATGSNRTAYRQTRGVCVSRGTGGAILDSYLFALAMGGRIGKPVDIATEPIYAGSRMVIGRGQLGSGEGSCGCWAAEYVSRYGVVERALYGGFDLRQADDDMACNWSSRPGASVPPQVQNAGLIHLVSSHKVNSTSELADAICAGYFGAVCRSRYCSSVDAEGFGVFGNQGGHCTEVSGWYVDRHGKTRFVEQQSHGTGRPTPNPIANVYGDSIPLRDGSYPVREEDMAEAIARGECWVFSLRRGMEFREAA